MKAFLEHIPSSQQQSVVFREISQANFDTPFHYHPEVELTLIEKGSGIRHVGMKMEEFEEGDLVLLGSGLPHCWLSEPSDKGEQVASFVVQFHQEVLSASFATLPEFAKIHSLLESSVRGIKFKGKELQEEMRAIFKLSGSRQILALLGLFDHLAHADKSFILSEGLSKEKGHERYHEVFSFIISNFRRPIALAEVAAVAGLSTTSFCRYFKEVTGKTLFEVLQSYRLEAAAQLLLSSNKRINEIAFDSGFEDVPYFNRVFKKEKGVSPRTFRRG